LADTGANEFQIMAFLAHKNIREALHHVGTAKRKKLAADGMAQAHAENLSGLSGWLDKTNTQATERNGRK